MKCPECGLVTFDDVPQCPRCDKSFALVRPLATASLDGARHLLRDDPELRVKLRDRLHRARLDRRKQNQNPLAAAPDADAPDWFVPLPSEENGAAEAMAATAPANGGPSKEAPIVNSDDLSADDDVRGGATTTDAEINIEITGAEPLPIDDEPQFDGDIPGFADWREELRERLKRIRARRDEEQLEDGGDAEEVETSADIDEPEADDLEAIEPDEKVEEIEGVRDIEEEEATGPDSTDEVDVEEADEVDVDEAEQVEEADEVDVDEAEETDEADVDGAEQIEETDEADVDEAEQIEETDAADVAGAEQVEETDAADVDGAEQVEETDTVEVDGAEQVEETDAVEVDEVEGADEVEVPEADEVEVEVAEEMEVEEETESLAAGDVDAGKEPEVVVLEEDDEVVVKQTEVVGFGAAIVEPAAEPEETPAAAKDGVTDEVDLEATGGTDIELAETAGEQDVDFTIDQQTDDIVLDLDLVEDNIDAATEKLEALDADDAEVVADPSDEPEEGPAADFDWGAAATDELEPFAEPAADGEPEISTGEAIERLDAIFDEPSEAGDLETGDDDEPAGDLPPAVMPDLPDADEPTTADDSVPELDFEEATPAAATPALDLDLPGDDAKDAQALEWDEEVVEPRAEHSSAGPLGERAAAALCDLLVLTAIGSALVGAASSGTGLPFRQILVEEAFGLGIAWAIFVVGYSVFFVGSCGQTIGRMVMRLRVVGTDQFSVGFGRAAIRLAAWVVSALPLLAGMLPALRDPQRRGLHDRLSRTRVVKA